MKNWRFWLAVLSAYVQVLAAVLLYWMGAGFSLVMLALQYAQTRLIDRLSGSRGAAVLLCINHAAATALAHYVEYTLFCARVSSDDLSLWLGQAGLVAGIVIVAAMSAYMLKHRQH